MSWKKFNYLLYLFLTPTLLILGWNGNGQSAAPQIDRPSFQSIADPVIIDGNPWTFKTAPPPENQRTVRKGHPKLLITQDNLPGLRKKLQDPVYEISMKTLLSLASQGDHYVDAFLYLLNLEGDAPRGKIAKAYLLAGDYYRASVKVDGLDSIGKWATPILMYDWIADLLNAAEKQLVFEHVKASFPFDHRDPPESYRGVSHDHWYWNDMWARHPHTIYPLLALAIKGDGVDEVWADEVLEIAYDDENPVIVSPYGATKGSGMLDVLMTLSLDDGGGEQVGINTVFANGYYRFFLHGFLALAAWETATEQPMFPRTPYFQQIPRYWAYSAKDTIDNLGKSILEMITGIYKDVDADSASLAKWMLDQRWGESSYTLMYRLILGDLRIAAKSPQEIGLPTTKYTRGADLFSSRSDWKSDAVIVSAYSRYLDTSRYEPASGVFGIHKGQTPLTVRGTAKKVAPTPGSYSGMWIYDPSTGVHGQGSTYWQQLNNYSNPPPRAERALDVVTNPGYFPGGPDLLEINETYRAISMEYGKLFKATPVNTCRRTIVHIPGQQRDFIVVYDYVNTGDNLRNANSMRLATEPTINGHQYAVPGMTTTVVAPQLPVLTWVGGLNKEFNSPPPEEEWYSNNRGGFGPGFSADADKASQAGIGNLFVQTQNPQNEVEYLMVIEVSDFNPVNVIRFSDREVSFDKWHLTFNQQGTFEIKSSDQPSVCGNGSVEGFEQCDDGNLENKDGCSFNCKLEKIEPEISCGNGILEEGEQCDDGNLINGDGCSLTCEKEKIIFEHVIHVSPQGNDSNDGGVNRPLRSIQKSFSMAKPGSTIIVHDGIYNESLTTNTDGSTTNNRVILKAENKHGAIITNHGRVIKIQNSFFYHGRFHPRWTIW